MISLSHRQTAIALIEQAVATGARRTNACAELEISSRTLRRWTQGGQLHADQRPLVPRPHAESGSSPRGRGTLSRDADNVLQQRFIPVSTG